MRKLCAVFLLLAAACKPFVDDASAQGIAPSGPSDSQTFACVKTSPSGGKVDFSLVSGDWISLDGVACGGSVANSYIGANGAVFPNIQIISSSGSIAANTSVTGGSSPSSTLSGGSLSTSAGSSFGVFEGSFPGTVTTGTNFGVYPVTTGTNLGGLKLNAVSCVTTTTAGTGTTGTLIIKDVTGASTLCTPYSATFNCAAVAGTPQTTGSCNAAPTAGHVYSYELSGCTTFPVGLDCGTDLTH